jgi:hypothetical protein
LDVDVGVDADIARVDAFDDDAIAIGSTRKVDISFTLPSQSVNRSVNFA